MQKKFKYTLLLMLASLLLVGSVVLAQDDDDSEEVELLVPEIISVRPHDTAAYTQGLQLFDGLFYETTGRYGQSGVRLVDPETGEVLRQVNLNRQIFGEGVALVEDRLIQLTWQAGVAIVFNRDTFEPLEFFQYEGEGWGLCYDGEQLYMSNGSDTLAMRDPQTFEVLDEIQVIYQDEPIDQLNELECVGDFVYANVWKSDSILKIDKESGEVTTLIDASGLLPAEEKEAMLAADAGAVLNGIAYDEEHDVFLLTGKLWDRMFEVRFVEPE